ncbi:transcriptional regulator, partial [Cutibacterium acnes subsp. acnes]|nr:transcriptional regulator [Cutibacterium acnes subsp. acnes]
VIDLLHGGQGMFAIALGGVWRDVQGSLAELPSERLNPVVDTELDEFTARRIAKHAS